MPEVDISGAVAHLRSSFDSYRTRDIGWRLEQLRCLKTMVLEREADIFAALKQDLGKSTFESWVTETGFVVSDIDYAIKRLRAWMKPQKVSTPLINQPGSSAVHREPLGVILIIGAWNYPFQLVMSPLVGAIAAGNCTVVKPSEVSAETSAVVVRGICDYLDQDAIRVIEGGVPETTALLKERFDHIFYTGGRNVGRIVMEAAAKHLTPVTLELGGKNPCIVDCNVNLAVAARRIVWGKFLNAGQTCVAPDYVLVHEKVEPEFLDRMKSAVQQFYGANPKDSLDYPRIINERHFKRLKDLLDCGEVVTGGETDRGERYIAPTILRDVPPNSPVMDDEIFGPILPVLTVSHVDEAISFINARPKPLALYIFSQDKRLQQRVLQRTSSGGVCVNDVVVHVAVPELPFGGVGASGTGAYHGRASFETFSHRKSVLRKSMRVDLPVRYPPYSVSKLKWIKRLL